MDDRELIVSLTQDASPFRTICEVHREMWDQVLNLPESDIREKLKELLTESFGYAKRMDSKLREYHAEWTEGLYETNPEQWKIQAKRMKRE